eukprot:1134625-Pelagomonas_calceolata.AAC.1
MFSTSPEYDTRSQRLNGRSLHWVCDRVKGTLLVSLHIVAQPFKPCKLAHGARLPLLRRLHAEGSRDWANEMPDALLCSIFDIIITAPTAHPSYLCAWRECMFVCACVHAYVCAWRVDDQLDS